MPHRGKVYVIDDDEAMRDSLDFLLGAANFHVTLFESAHHFLDTLSSIEFGCVVSDVRMPGIDGIELLKRLKAGPTLFPVVIMTGHGDVPLAVEAMKLGAVDFLEKPFEDDRLIGMIDAALKKAEPGLATEAITLEIASRIATLVCVYAPGFNSNTSVLPRAFWIRSTIAPSLFDWNVSTFISSSRPKVLSSLSISLRRVRP